MCTVTSNLLSADGLGYSMDIKVLFRCILGHFNISIVYKRNM